MGQKPHWLGLRLSDQEPVEGVAVVERQCLNRKRMGVADRKALEVRGLEPPSCV